MTIVEIPENLNRPAFEADRRRKLARISEREEWVVASLLDNLGKPWGPNVCAAIANKDYWENPVARRLAVAITSAQSNLTLANISLKLALEDKAWLRHPMFYKNGLPIEAAEYYAFDLCAHYRSQRLKRLIGDAYAEIKDHSEHADAIVSRLIEALQEFSRESEVRV